MTDLRRPTDEEQAVIARAYTMVSKIEMKRLTVLGIGMGRDLIEDAERGRWTMMFGKPVIQIDIPEQTRALVVIVEVPES